MFTKPENGKLHLSSSALGESHTFCLSCLAAIGSAMPVVALGNRIRLDTSLNLLQMHILP